MWTWHVFWRSQSFFHLLSKLVVDGTSKLEAIYRNRPFLCTSGKLRPLPQPKLKMTACRPCNAFVSFPDAEYTASLIRGALSKLGSNVTITSTVPEDTDGLTVQWSTYDDINHELTLKNPRNVLSGCYIIRKSLIRKHFLHRALQGYMAKHPNSILGTAVPHTWDIEINHLDELDELWVDDLYDLVELLSEENNDWFILKPGMADRGMGIRLFKSKAGLQEIFESFEESDGDEEIEKEDESKTGVVTSQLRHFVIQVSVILYIVLTLKWGPARHTCKTHSS